MDTTKKFMLYAEVSEEIKKKGKSLVYVVSTAEADGFNWVSVGKDYAVEAYSEGGRLLYFLTENHFEVKVEATRKSREEALNLAKNILEKNSYL